MSGEGGLREVRRLREVEADGGYVDYVAKWFKFEAEKREWYFAEAEAQMVVRDCGCTVLGHGYARIKYVCQYQSCMV